MESSFTLLGIVRAAEKQKPVYGLVGLQLTDLFRGEARDPCFCRSTRFKQSQCLPKDNWLSAVGRWAPACVFRGDE